MAVTVVTKDLQLGKDTRGAHGVPSVVCRREERTAFPSSCGSLASLSSGIVPSSAGPDANANGSAGVRLLGENATSLSMPSRHGMLHHECHLVKACADANTGVKEVKCKQRAGVLRQGPLGCTCGKCLRRELRRSPLFALPKCVDEQATMTTT